VARFAIAVLAATEAVTVQPLTAQLLTQPLACWLRLKARDTANVVGDVGIAGVLAAMKQPTAQSSRHELSTQPLVCWLRLSHPTRLLQLVRYY
jgi:hypothetical protein